MCSSQTTIGHLTTLTDLSRNLLTGQLPPQLVKLQSLQSLDLSFNPLGLVNVPKWFSKLEMLA
jgi:hypothetical protein